MIGANRAGQFFHLIPVFGSILAILFLGERPEWDHGVGYALILAGIVVGHGNWSLFGNVAVPLINDPNGYQDEQDYRLQLGFQVGM